MLVNNTICTYMGVPIGACGNANVRQIGQIRVNTTESIQWKTDAHTSERQNMRMFEF